MELGDRKRFPLKFDFGGCRQRRVFGLQFCLSGHVVLDDGGEALGIALPFSEQSRCQRLLQLAPKWRVEQCLFEFGFEVCVFRCDCVEFVFRGFVGFVLRVLLKMNVGDRSPFFKLAEERVPISDDRQTVGGGFGSRETGVELAILSGGSGQVGLGDGVIGKGGCHD